LNLERLLTSSCRQKILKELSRCKKIHIMGLVRKINSTYIEVNRNVKMLEGEGIVTDQRVGRMRMIRLNSENPKTVLLLQALKILNTQTKGADTPLNESS
jgi:DNA-binding transcriptional ArsR family regulator